jgi:hypothetical protein
MKYNDIIAAAIWGSDCTQLCIIATTQKEVTDILLFNFVKLSKCYIVEQLTATAHYSSHSIPVATDSRHTKI